MLVVWAAIVGTIVWCADHQELKYLLDAVKAVPGGDKVGHFVLVGGLGFLLNWTLRCREFWCAGRLWLLGSAIVFGIFTVDEVTQIWRPARTFDLLDLAANYAGIWFFGGLARRVVKREEAGRSR
ncbi:hypothetical protein LBMAG56_26590 [Verrucomicrobiota bacterium]|nr:hypothetical protein LBMAG56_26590 [Verrucomicrobiota bacterium]